MVPCLVRAGRVGLNGPPLPPILPPGFRNGGRLRELEFALDPNCPPSLGVDANGQEKDKITEDAETPLC